MADEKQDKKEEQIDVSTNEEEETLTVTEQDKTEKGFSQSDVNRIVQTRLKKVNQEHETEVQGYQEQITTYENIIKEMIDAKSKDLPESVKKLLGKLSIADALEFLNSEEAQISKKKIPSTPKPSGEGNQKKSEKPLNIFKI